MIRSILYLCCGSFAAVLFLTVWERMPASWLFDTADPHPHPLAHRLTLFPWDFTVFLCFIAATLILGERTPQTGVFWSLGLFWFLAQAALADACYRLIPDQWPAAVAALGILRLCGPLLFSASAASDFPSALAAQLIPLCFCAGLMLFFYALPRQLCGAPLMGLGDMKLLFALAVALPSRLFTLSLIRSSLLGGIAAGILLFTRRAERGVPYGTVLAFAVGWAVLFP